MHVCRLPVCLSPVVLSSELLVLWHPTLEYTLGSTWVQGVYPGELYDPNPYPWIKPVGFDAGFRAAEAGGIRLLTIHMFYNVFSLGHIQSQPSAITRSKPYSFTTTQMYRLYCLHLYYLSHGL